MGGKFFKKIFCDIAKQYGFVASFGAWFKESKECIFIIQLIKSNFGNHYMVDVKVYIQKSFGNHYIKDKGLLRDIGDISRREPKEFRSALDLEAQIEDIDRKEQLEPLFCDFISPFSKKALTLQGIKELAETGEIYLLPAVKGELKKIEDV